jgi:tRNA threonylcarbamoyladenosine biosynthesis protein TsaE
MSKKIISKSDNQTRQIAKVFADSLSGGEVIALTGDLGAGKTTFTKGIALALGIKDKITSPTFVLMKQYITKLNKQKIKNFIHTDCYRFVSSSDALSIGLDEYLGQSKTICIIEWPEIIQDILPDETIWININHVSEDEREIIFN